MTFMVVRILFYYNRKNDTYILFEFFLFLYQI
jgi:hypothetical protein